MKLILAFLLAAALVVAAPTDDTTKSPFDFSDVLQSISKVSDRLKTMREIASHSNDTLSSALVVAAPTDNTTKSPFDFSDLLQSISKVSDRLKTMREIVSDSNYTLSSMAEVPGDCKKNVTYEDLLKQSEIARQKMSEIQTRLSNVLNYLKEKYPSPNDVQQPIKAHR